MCDVSHWSILLTASYTCVCMYKKISSLVPEVTNCLTARPTRIFFDAPQQRNQIGLIIFVQILSQSLLALYQQYIECVIIYILFYLVAKISNLVSQHRFIVFSLPAVQYSVQVLYSLLCYVSCTIAICLFEQCCA